MSHRPRGDIFRRHAHSEERVPFAEAFPDIATIDTEVDETGEGNVGLGLRRFQRLTVRETINCSSHLCAGRGFSLGQVIREMVKTRDTRRDVVRPCESLEESGRPCPNRFIVKATITYKS